jgi:pyruvate kinase
VRQARSWLDSVGMGSTRVLAKVETRQALLNFRCVVLMMMCDDDDV